MSPIYLDCNATTPLEPEVRYILLRYLTEEFGNEGSRLAILGLRAAGVEQDRRHIKLHAPKGVGALIARRRGYTRPPLRPLAYGGGQERGLRPGTLPVALIVALGLAAEIAVRDHARRQQICRHIREQALAALMPLEPCLTGNRTRVMDHVLNLAFPGLDSEALMVGLKDLIAISNGSACTSSSYTPSHVLKAMGLNDDRANGCVRISWCHLTPPVDWEAVANRIRSLR